MTAELLVRSKRIYDNGAIAELKLWRVPVPVRGSAHEFKYSLYYGRGGIRLIAYDNEAGKGDHRHYGDRQENYVFVSVETLLADFLADVQRQRESL